MKTFSKTSCTTLATEKKNCLRIRTTPFFLTFGYAQSFCYRDDILHLLRPNDLYCTSESLFQRVALLGLLLLLWFITNVFMFQYLYLLRCGFQAAAYVLLYPPTKDWIAFCADFDLQCYSFETNVCVQYSGRRNFVDNFAENPKWPLATSHRHNCIVVCKQCRH